MSSKVLWFLFLHVFRAAAGKVFVDLERGAKALIKATGSETSKTVEHK